MGYMTDWALVVGSKIKDDFLRKAKKSNNDFITGMLTTSDKILEHENGDLLFVSDIKGGFEELVSELNEIFDDLDEDGDHWLLRTVGEDQGETEDWGNYWDNPFSVCIQREWWINDNKTKKLEDVPWRTALTAMKEAVENGKERS